jgi:class 3 adenylate cyclase/tetratricopeptide (TPR) repeat protein
MSDAVASPETRRDLLGPYVPRLATDLSREVGLAHEVEGSLVFADISGFTKMSERLARHGKVGAEEVSAAINRCFTELLAVAYDNGGSLLKFGGDALLLLFSDNDHPERAVHAAAGMRSKLREVGRLDTIAGTVHLRISIGVHSDVFTFFMVGRDHRELVVTGPAASAAVASEAAATAGTIVLSAATAARLPDRCRGLPRGDGFVLRTPPPALPPLPTPQLDTRGVDLATLVPAALRRHLEGGVADPEHRNVSVAFVHFDGTDELVRANGPHVVAEMLETLVNNVQARAKQHDITFLGSDIDQDGGKIILVAGAPRRAGDDETRLLLTLGEIVGASNGLPVRVGVNWGPVFAGEIGPPYRRTYTVMGDTVNLAARLMARADPGQIIATPAVLERSGLAFDVDELPPFTVKGKRRPVQAFAVGAPRRARTARLTALPMVGRDAELRALDDDLDAVRSGAGRLVEFVGEAGIGKTRLTEALLERAVGMATISLRCEPYEATTPYAAFAQLGRALLGCSPDESRRAVASRLRQLVHDVAPELEASLPLIGTALHAAIPDDAVTSTLEPEFRRRRVVEMTGAFIDRALPRPVVVLVEDAQHMDEASSALLEGIVEGLARRPALICVTRRDAESGFAATASPVVHTRELRGLSEEHARRTIVAATQTAPLRPATIDVIVRRAGGNPFFLVELLRAAAEAGDDEALPESIDAVVTAQIDRLAAPARRILRHASVLGRSFTNDLLDELLGDRSTTATTLAQLDEFLTVDGIGSLTFRQALVRDVAYEGLPFRTRRELHARAADAILRRRGDDVGDDASVVSLHCLNAHRFDQAFAYASAAGASAAASYANVEATASFERALAAARRLTDLPSRDVAAVWVALGDVRQRAGNFAGAAAAYRTARRLAGDDPVFDAHMMLKEVLLADRLGRASVAVRWIRRGQKRLTDADGNDVDGGDAAHERAQLSVAFAMIRQSQGRQRDAIRAGESALEIARAAGDLDAEAHACCVLDLAWASVGEFDQAVHSDRALELYDRLHDIGGKAIVLNNLGAFAYYQGRWDDAVDLYEQGRAARLATGNDVDAASGTCNIGEVLSDQGHYDQARHNLDDALRVYRASRFRYGVGYASMLLGRLSARTGCFDDADEYFAVAHAEFKAAELVDDVRQADVAVAEAALLRGDHATARSLAERAIDDAARDHAVPLILPLAQRIRGQVFFASGSLAEARDAFEASLSAARTRGAQYDEALGLIALAGLKRAEGDADAAGASERDGRYILDRLGVVAVPFPAFSHQG